MKFYQMIMRYEDLKNHLPIFEAYGNNPISYSSINNIKKIFEKEENGQVGEKTEETDDTW